MERTDGAEVPWVVRCYQQTPTAEGPGRWVQFDGFASQADAEYFGQCRWAGREGRDIVDVHVAQQPLGPWHAVAPASVCGGERLHHSAG